MGEIVKAKAMKQSAVANVPINYHFYQNLKTAYIAYVQENDPEKVQKFMQRIKDGGDAETLPEHLIAVLTAYIFEIERCVEEQGLFEEIEIDPKNPPPGF